MTASIVSNSTAATFGNSPQKTGEPLDHATLFSGKALEFDGVADSLVSSCAAITLGDPFTFSAWINVDNVSGTKLIATNGITTNSRYFIVEGNDLALLNYKGSYASDVKIKTSTITLTAGVWHYVGGTFDGDSTGALYIDGALDKVGVGATPITYGLVYGGPSKLSVVGDLGVSSHITSSGNISASGAVYGSTFYDLGVEFGADYVFEPEYVLRTLTEVEEHIEEHQHLPGIPSVDDINGWKQLSIGDRDMKLLEKVEELTLYIIDLHKRIEELEKQ